MAQVSFQPLLVLDLQLVKRKTRLKRNNDNNVSTEYERTTKDLDYHSLRGLNRLERVGVWSEV